MGTRETEAHGYSTGEVDQWAQRARNPAAAMALIENLRVA